MFKYKIGDWVIVKNNIEETCLIIGQGDGLYVLLTNRNSNLFSYLLVK